jgi:hypothetical protein
VLSSNLQVQWVLANLAGSSIGFGVFAVLAHGLTCPHDEIHPSLAQFAAHTIGLLPAGAIIALSQRLVLGRHRKMARWFVPVVSLTMTAAFLIGAYVLRPPWDFLLCYAVIGAVVELAMRPIGEDDRREAFRRAAVTGLWFAVGSFVGMLILSLFAKALGLRLGEMGEDVPHHIMTMSLGGLFIGAATGLLSARRIAKRVLQVGSDTPD